jgi:hypothetical protein
MVMKKFLVVLISVGALVACSGLGGTKQGDSCGGSTDDCASNLTCQPIKGKGSYCCPSPPESSDYQSCHPAN